MVDQATLREDTAWTRRYDDEALTLLATLSSVFKSESLRHLAELITRLSAFERYSTGCESRGPRDAPLRALLHATASHARHIATARSSPYSK